MKGGNDIPKYIHSKFEDHSSKNFFKMVIFLNLI